MSCLGVHFALTEEDATTLLLKATDADRLEFVQEDIEERYFDDDRIYVAQSDKAWDAMHRGLAGGPLRYEGGDYPLNLAVIGGDPLYGAGDYIMSLKTPSQVKVVAAALASLTHDQFRQRYQSIDSEDYGFDLTDEDFEYTWNWLQEVTRLYQTAAAEGRHVLFTADQ